MVFERFWFDFVTDNMVGGVLFCLICIRGIKRCARDDSRRKLHVEKSGLIYQEIKHRHMHMHWHVMKAVWSNLMFGKEGKLVWTEDRAAYTHVRKGE